MTQQIDLRQAAAQLRTLSDIPTQADLRPPSTMHGRALTVIGQFLKGVSDRRRGNRTTNQREDRNADLAKTAESDQASAPIFQELPKGILYEALRSGTARRLVLHGDDLLSQDIGPVIVLRGQLALARFAPDAALPETPIANSTQDPKAAKEFLQRRINRGPLARQAERLFLHFERGELIEPIAITAAAGARLIAITSSEVIAIAPSRLDAWGRMVPAFRARRQRAAELLRERLAAIASEHGQLADFFIRHGKSIAATLRVRDLDRCIDCKACEDSCTERHGAQRLSLNGQVIGRFDLVRTCQTCSEPRCVEVCGYDAIRYDAQKGEVVISPEACTGCTLCSLACPYDAITMLELADQPRLRALLQPAAKSPERASAEPGPRRLANKCDHCAGFADQACISACPTGAIFETDAAALFRARPASLVRSLAEGFAQSIDFVAPQYFAPDLLQKSAGGTLPAEVLRTPRHKSAPNRLLRYALPLFFALIVALPLAEILLRSAAPEHSILYRYLTSIGKVQPRIARLDAGYRPTSGLALAIGHVAVLLFLIALVYPWLKAQRPHSRWLSRLSAQQLFALHVGAGGATIFLVGMHSALNLTPTAQSVTELTAGAPLVGFWLLVLIGITGIAGRLLGDGTSLRARLGQACRTLHGPLSRAAALLIAAHVLFEYIVRPLLEAGGGS